MFVELNTLRNCRHGRMLFNRHDRYIGRSLELYGEYSQGEVELFRCFVAPAQVVVEVGANIGAHTLFFARHVGLGGRVIAIEPQRLLFQTLAANMALNDVPNTWCHQLALGEAAGEIFVPPLDYSQDNNFGGLALGSYSSGERVAVRTLDSLELPRCDFIKIDVEGMEASVLAGATATIARHAPRLYVENDKQEKAAALIRMLATLGYNMYWHQPPYFNPGNYFENPHNVFGDTLSINMLCLPRNATLDAAELARFGLTAVGGA